MRLLDSRRLTGPSFLSRSPAALVELGLDPGETPGLVISAFRTELSRLHRALGLPEAALLTREFAGGAAVAVPGPIDLLLPLCEVNDRAALGAAAVLRGEAPLPLEPLRAELAAMFAAARNERLLLLQAAAAQVGIPFLWDDEQVTLGLGGRSRSFALGALPRPEEVPWRALGRIPVALVTGTNGKTTSARLLARIGAEAGLVAGTASTGGVVIREATVEKGDWTGPAAARRVLRDPNVELAVLETARGGILRRGLAVESCDAALITNVSSDHLGDYGVDDLPTMARAKAVVGTVVRPEGRVVLNALDPELVALAGSFPAPVTYFSSDPAAPPLAAHLAGGGEAFVARDGFFVKLGPSGEQRLLPIKEAPLTFGGAAIYNVENALGAAATAAALGIPATAIAAGLRAFDTSAVQNPGRGNLFAVGGVRVLVDFGHNPAAVLGVLTLVDRLRHGKGALRAITGMAGDRSDEDIRAVARAIHRAGPAQVFVRELEKYLRGRAPGAVPALIREELLRLGLPDAAVVTGLGEVEALGAALDASVPGDFVLLLVHLDEEGVGRLLARRDARPL